MQYFLLKCYEVCDTTDGIVVTLKPVKLNNFFLSAVKFMQSFDFNRICQFSPTQKLDLTSSGTLIDYFNKLFWAHIFLGPN